MLEKLTDNSGLGRWGGEHQPFLRRRARGTSPPGKRRLSGLRKKPGRIVLGLKRAGAFRQGMGEQEGSSSTDGGRGVSKPWRIGPLIKKRKKGGGSERPDSEWGQSSNRKNEQFQPIRIS